MFQSANDPDLWNYLLFILLIPLFTFFSIYVLFAEMSESSTSSPGTMPSTPTATTSEPPIVHTRYGTLEGLRVAIQSKSEEESSAISEEVDLFLGVPYAQPPLGPLRAEVIQLILPKYFMVYMRSYLRNRCHLKNGKVSERRLPLALPVSLLAYCLDSTVSSIIIFPKIASLWTYSDLPNRYLTRSL